MKLRKNKVVVVVLLDPFKDEETAVLEVAGGQGHDRNQNICQKLKKWDETAADSEK